MYLDNKKTILLNYLGNDISTVSKQLNISERTVRYRIKDLNTFFDDNKINCSLILVHKILKLEGEFPDLKKYLNNENYILSTNERIKMIILLLLSNSTGYKSEEISCILNISRSTLKNDLKLVRRFLKKYDITVVSKANKGLIIIGDELKIRKILLGELKKYFSICDNSLKLNKNIKSQTYTIIHNFVSIYTINIVKIFLFEVKLSLNKQISDEAFEVIFIYLLICISRLKLGLELDFCSNTAFIKSTEDYKAIKKNISLIEKSENLIIKDSEIFKITEFILGAHTYNFNYSFYENWIHLDKLISNFIDEVNSYLNIDISKDVKLREGIINHIVPTIYRLKNDIEFENSIYDDILLEHKDLYFYVKKSLKYIENFINKEFSQNEISFLVVHFILAIKRIKEHTIIIKKAIIVCGLGYGTSNLLQQEIEDIFNINIVKLIPLHSLNKISLDKIDFIISTTEINNLNLKIPYLKVNPILNKEDIINLINLNIETKKRIDIDIPQVIKIIKKYSSIADQKRLKEDLSLFLNHKPIEKKEFKEKTLLEILPLKNIKIIKKIDNWNNAIDIAGSILLKNNYIKKNYIEEMKNKIKELGLYMLIGDQIILPHGDISNKIIKTGISYLQLIEPVIFPGNIKIKHIFSLASLDFKEHVFGLLQLKEIIDKPNFKNELENCNHELDIFNVIKKNIKEN